MKVDQTDWIRDSAVHGMESVENTPILLVGSLIAGCLAMSFSGLWIVGAGVAGAGMYLAERRHGKVLDAVDYSIKYGAAPAAIKSEKQLREYADHMGREQTAQQLLQAAKSDIPLNRAQWRFLEDHYEDQLDDLLDRPMSDRDIKFFHELPPIRLSPQRDGGQDSQPTAQNATLPVVDVADRMGKTLKPTIISALPRTGKGILLAQGWRAAKKHNPGLKVYVIDPKAHPNESGYWDGCDRVLAIRFDQIPVNCPTTIAALEQFIDEWRSDPASEKLLIFDEQIAVRAKLPKWYREYVIPMIQSEGSAGETFKRYLWVVMQSPLVGDIGLSGGGRSIYVHCAIATDREQEGMNPKAWMNSSKASGFIPSIPAASHFEASPRGTLCYSSLIGEWVALPEYPVFAPRHVGHPPVHSPDQTKISDVVQDPQLATDLEQERKSVGVTERDAVRIIQEQGLLFQPAQVSENLFQPIQPPNVIRFAPKDESATEIAAKQLAEKINEVAINFRAQAEEMKPEFQKLVKEERDDLLWIAALSAEKGEITARMVSQRMKRKPWIKVVEATGSNLNEAIRLKFSELSDRSLGDCFGQGDRLTYLLFTGDDRVITVDSEDSVDAVDIGEEGSING